MNHIFSWSVWTVVRRLVPTPGVEMHHDRDRVSESSLVCVIGENQRLLGLEPLSSVVNSEWWLSSLTERKSSCIVLARPLVYKNLSAVHGLRFIQFSFVCKSLVLFVFFPFSCCVTLRVGPSLQPTLWGKPSSVFVACSWVSLPRLLPHPFISNKHTGYVYQSRDK